MEPNTQRWTAGKKTELVVSILKQEKTLVDACRENDLKQSEVKKWIDQFLEGGRPNLKVNSKVVMVQHRREVEALQRKVGERVLKNDIQKIQRSAGRAGRDDVLNVQSELKSEERQASLRTICSVLA
jgi:transposase-like protein